MLRTSAINLVLKVGLSVASFGFALLSFIKGSEIVAYFPSLLVDLIGEVASLIIGVIIALFMAVWLLSRRHKFASAFTYTLLIGFGMLFNLTSFTFLSITWPLFCMSLALSLRYYPRVRIVFEDKDGKQKMKIVPAATENTTDAEDRLNTPLPTRKEFQTYIKSKIDLKKLKHSPKVAQAQEEKVEYGEEEPFLEDRKDNDIAHKYPTATIAAPHDVPTSIDEEEQLNAFDVLGPEPLGQEIDESEILIQHSAHPSHEIVSDTVHDHESHSAHDTHKSPRTRKPKADLTTKDRIDHSPLAEAIKKIEKKQRATKSAKESSELDSLAEAEVPPLDTVLVDENPRIAKKRQKARVSRKSQVDVQ